jgi:hypothetical protein
VRTATTVGALEGGVMYVALNKIQYYTWKIKLIYEYNLSKMRGLIRDSDYATGWRIRG